MAEITKNSENGADVVGAVIEVDGIVAVEYVGRKRTVVAAVTYGIAVGTVAVGTELLLLKLLLLKLLLLKLLLLKLLLLKLLLYLLL